MRLFSSCKIGGGWGGGDMFSFTKYRNDDVKTNLKYHLMLSISVHKIGAVEVCFCRCKCCLPLNPAVYRCCTIRNPSSRIQTRSSIITYLFTTVDISTRQGARLSLDSVPPHPPFKNRQWNGGKMASVTGKFPLGLPLPQLVLMKVKKN